MTWRGGYGESSYFVYIMANKRNGTIYIGVTNDLLRRVYEHREGLVKGFTSRYGLKMIVYYEVFDSIANAIQRETSLKRWPRKWKLDLIESRNPQWRDLYEEIGL
jgi:putative endonuclease